DCRFHVEIRPPQVGLDRHLPQAGSAEQQGVAGVFQKGARLFREPLWLGGRPEQEEGIEQVLHAGMPNSAAISSSPMRSKSSGTDKAPCRNPSRWTSPASGAPMRITFTIGLPALAMTTVSPAAARSTRRERWVLASWMLTVDMAGLWFGLSSSSLVLLRLQLKSLAEPADAPPPSPVSSPTGT